MTEKSKYIKYLVILFLFLLIVKGSYIISVMREKKYNFKGPIERIEYDEKKAVTVKVNENSSIFLLDGSSMRK